MRVIVADSFEDSGRRGLSDLGCEVTYDPDLSGDGLVAALRSVKPDVLVVRSTKVTRAMLETGSLALVVRAGAGTNTIDVAAASELGIWVANCPGKNAIAVAELTFALMLALDRRVPENARDLKAGAWNKKEYSKARGIFGRTLGVIGTGAIGREVIARANAFGMRVVAWGRGLTDARAEELGVERKASISEVASEADILTVHVAYTAETKHLIGDGVFASMKPGSLFINTSRAEVVDQSALERAIVERGLRAGVDVFDNEPAGGTGALSSPLFSLPNVIGTHHIGASTDQAQEAIAAETVRIVSEFKTSGRVATAVNLAKKSPATKLITVRHRDRVGVLASVFDCLKRAGINVQEMENIVFEGADAAVARIYIAGDVHDDTLDALRQSSSDILAVSLFSV